MKPPATFFESVIVAENGHNCHNEAKIYTGFEGAKTAYEDAVQNFKKGEELLGRGLMEQPESWEI